MHETTPGISPRTESEKVRNHKTKITRRQFLGKGIAAIVGAGLLTGGYAWQWEPRRLETTRLELALQELPAAFDGVKVAHISDTHLGFNKDAKDIAGLVDRIQADAPDLICFTGDMVDSYAEDLIDAVPFWSRLEAPLGKFAILGNHDYKNTELLTGLLKDSGFRVLRNEFVLIRRGQAVIAVTGLEDMLQGRPDPETAIQHIPADTFNLLLMHEPDYALTAEVYPFHLQLSGHSHGGQIRLPLVGALFTPYGSEKYISGLYYTEAKGMPVYVNRGFGETYMPFRLFCRPELVMLTLRRA
ncbi:metallophosphoesterase [Paenibacillus sp. sgz500958]|uniref:metallophosphoesterase n=1 Tax=Paenibacillus sp. sgz500958 TaxID=3242475 RepID=UPI0036D247D5